MAKFLRRQFVPVWIWLAALLVCGVLVSRTTFTADLSAFLPRAPTPEQQLLVNQLRDGLVSRLILVGIEGADARTHAGLSKALAAKLRTDSQFTSVSNGEAGGLQRDQAFLFENRYQLSPAVTPARFSVDGLRTAIGESLDLLASPVGMVVKSLLPRDPTGEMTLLLEQLAGTASQPNSVAGVWASRDSRRALLLVQTRVSGSDTDGQQRAVDAIRAAFAAAQPPNTVSARLLLTGPGVFGVNVRQTIEQEVTRLSTISIVLIASLLLLIYRSVPALALGLLPVVSGALAGVAAVSLGFGSVHGITLGFGTTLIGEAVDYSIYLFVQSDPGAQSKKDWVRKFWPTVRLGVLTSVFGFSSLLLSGFPGLAQLGVYSITGLIAAAAVTRFVLPLLLPAGFRVRDVSAMGEGLARLVRHAGLLRWGASGLVLAACLVIVMNRNTLWNKELSALSPVAAADQALDAALRADLGAPDVRYLVVISGADQEKVLVAAELAVQALQALVDSNVIGGVDSPTRILPSQATQASRRASLPTAPELRERLSQALQGLPLQPARLAPFLADAAAARDLKPVQRADLEGTTLSVAVDGMLVYNRATPDPGQRWSALLPLHAPLASNQPGQAGAVTVIDPARIRRVLAPGSADANGGTQTRFVDLKGEADQLYAGYLREAIVLSLGGLVAIGALLLVTLRSAPGVLRVLTPLAGAVLTVTAGLVLAGQQLTILHLVGLLLIVAVGSNYALFFNAAQPAPGITARTLASLLFANLTTVAGFGLLAFSSVPVLQAMGVTVGPGAILALLFAAIFAQPASPSESSLAVHRWRPTVLVRASLAVHVGALILLTVKPALWPWGIAALFANHVLLALAGLLPRCKLLGANWTRLPAASAARGEIALTIDDGPDPAVTPAVLALLDRYGAKATFFCVGAKAALFPEICRDIVRRGHAIENHSQHHRHNFSLLGPAGCQRELEAAQTTLAAITGERPQFFRAPAGLRNPFLDLVLQRLGLQLASWTRRAYDTRVGNPAQVLQILTRSLQAGDILLLHDRHAAFTPAHTPVILEVLPSLLDAIRQAGLHTVTLRQARL